MSAIKVLNMAGAEVGTVELNDSIFGVEPNTAVVHEVVKNHLARSPGVRRVPVTPVRAAPARPSGPTAASCSPPSPAATLTF